MKILLADLKKAINWIESNTNETQVAVNETLGGVLGLTFSCTDKNHKKVEIHLYSDSMMLPKIRKEEVL